MKREIASRLAALGICPVGALLTPLGEQEVAGVEAVAGGRLPDDYRDFARTYGAATFGQLVEFRLGHPESLLAESSAPRYETAPFSHFYGGSAGPHDIGKKLQIYKHRMPEGLIPIGDDGAGNQICLGVLGLEHGKVYYWDHHNEWDEDDYEEEHGTPMPPEGKLRNMYLVADSFEEFIGRLKARE